MAGVSSREADRTHRAPCARYLLPRYYREYYDVGCASYRGKLGSGLGDALPHDGWVEKRVLLGVWIPVDCLCSYNLPSGTVLKKQGSRYSLTVPFSTPLQDADIVNLQVRLVLPECVRNVKFVLPEGVDEPTLDYRLVCCGSVN